MDSILIYSGEDLSSLWDIVKNRFPNQAAIFCKKNKLEVSRQYVEEFSRIFSVWYHNNVVKNEVSSLLSDVFVLTQEEEKDILQMIPEHINEHQGELCDIIYQNALIMLNEFHLLKTKGFSNFCMQEYRKKLEKIIDECLEQYLTEKDYHEFLNLLQYFVEVEECQFDELTVVADKDGNYIYYDQFHQNITVHCMEQFFYSEFGEENPTADDCMITVLILMLPQRITVYGIENILNKKFLNTLKTIFGNRIEFRVGTEIIQNHKM